MLKNNFFLLGLILLFPILFFLFSTSLTDQQIHLDRLSGMDKCFADWQIPCRWIKDVKNPYGYPIFNFHAPLPYYFGGLIFFITKNLTISLSLMFIVPIASIYFFTYLFSNIFIRKFASGIIAFFFSLISFYALVTINRTALGELWAEMFIVTSLYLIFLLKRKISIRNFLFFSMSLALLITSFRFAIVILLAVLLILVFLLFQKKKIMLIVIYITSFILGLFLSSFYIWPMIMENNLIRKNLLPIDVQEKPAAYENAYQILTGETKVLDYKEGSNWLSFKTETSSHTIIRLSRYYFPVWKVFVDGKEIKIDYKNNNMGLITFILGKGNHEVMAKLYDTPIRILSNLVTLGGIAISVLLFLISFVKVRQWLLYYKKRIN